MAGLNYGASDHMDLFAEYRFLEADAFRMESSVSSLTGNYDYRSQGVGFGFRWKF